ncbi:MAG: Rieske 2Fe-2S domain-containing protein [Bacteroidota bacterium]|nr:Rieske 2Fe-2S domain-containing protein [Bacteroidota bacterium]
MKWYSFPEIKDTDKPFIQKVKIADKSICVVGYEGKLFAVSAICPHQGFDLSLGSCENDKIICPVHGYSFDLQTGKGSQDYIKTYPVKIENGVVYVGTTSVWDDIKQLFNK